MNETNFDHLLQVTARRTNWQGANPSIGRNDQPAFDDHLAQASTQQALAEPSRPPDADRPESTSQPGRLPTQGTATPSDVENSDDAAIMPPAAESESRNEEDNSIETCCDAVPSETEAADAESEADPTKPTDIDAEQVEEESDDKNELTVDMAAVIEVVASADDGLLLSSVEIAGDLATPTVSVESAELVAAQNTSTSDRSSIDGSQRLEPVHGSTTTVETLPARARPPQVDARPSNSVAPTGAAAQAEDNTTRDAPETYVVSTPTIAKVDHPTSAREQKRAPSRETTTSAHPPATIAAEDGPQFSSTPKAETAPRKSEKNADESGATDGPRALTGRQMSRTEISTTAANTPPAVPVANVQPDVIPEASKSDAADESTRPSTNHSPHSESLLHPFARLQRVSGAVARTHGDAPTEDLPQVDAARFVSRVAKAFHTAQERGGVLQLRLSPPELGAMRLELLVQDGVLAAKMETETPAARRVLLDHLPVLRDRLAEQNIRIERFDVDVRQEGGGHSPSSPQHGRHQQPHQNSPHRQPSRQSVPNAESALTTSIVVPITTDTQINLVA